MENLALNLINEVVQQETFTVDNDGAAEWCLNKIREEQAELRRMEMVCNQMIGQYQMKLQQAKEQYENKTTYFRQQLQAYFEKVPHKATKTQETYELPSGKLKRKFGGVDYIKDDAILLEWVKANGGAEDFIQTKETVKWAELKKTITVKGDVAIDCDGEVIPGLTITTKPDKFEIEL